MGDYICFLPALEYIVDTYKHIEARVFCPDFILPIVKHVLGTRAEVQSIKNFNPGDVRVFPTIVPDPRVPPNHAAMHLVDLGFVIFANMAKAPDKKYYFYSRLQSDMIPVTQKMHTLGKYAVITPMATKGVDNRRMTPKLFHKLKNACLDYGINPVLLGKTDMTGTHKATAHSDFNLKECINLMDRTSLLETAKIIANAKFVVGIDNGLLHLAGMTDTPLIFGYTVASPEHRRPRRTGSPIYDVMPDPRVLQCTFCQSNMRFTGHADFRQCIYKDNKCIELLEASSLWKSAIDDIMKPK